MIRQEGQYNSIHPTVQFIPFKGSEAGPVIIGDCNVIHEGVRIFVGPSGFRMGDYNVIHTGATLIGGGPFHMGHNCWIGQGAYLDHTGNLRLGNGVTVSCGWHVWTHIARGELIEGWRHEVGLVVLEDDVWLVGNDGLIAPGVVMGARSAALALSVVTRDVPSDMVVAGIPARSTTIRLRAQGNISLPEKMAMMRHWTNEFASLRGIHAIHRESSIEIVKGEEVLVVIDRAPDEPGHERFTYFNLSTKQYTKRLTPLELDFVAFLRDGNKARFTPAEENY